MMSKPWGGCYLGVFLHKGRQCAHDSQLQAQLMCCPYVSDSHCHFNIDMTQKDSSASDSGMTQGEFPTVCDAPALPGVWP